MLAMDTCQPTAPLQLRWGFLSPSCWPAAVHRADSGHLTTVSSPHQREHGGHGPTLLFRDTGKLIQAHAHVRLCVCVLVCTQLCEVSCLGLTRAMEPESRHPSVLQSLWHSHCCLHGGAELYTQVGT